VLHRFRNLIGIENMGAAENVDSDPDTDSEQL